MVSKRILIVDDEPGTRFALAELLREEDYEIAVAADGSVAFDLARRFEPDLVLSDVEMPNLDGLQLLRSLRFANVHAPAILMTAHSLRDGRLMESLGAEALLVKPFDVDDLLCSIARTLHDDGVPRRETTSALHVH